MTMSAMTKSVTMHMSAMMISMTMYNYVSYDEECDNADVGYGDDYDNAMTMSAMTKSVAMQMLAIVMIMTMTISAMT